MIPSASVSEEKTEPKEVNFSSRPVQEEPKREERSAAMTRETYQKPKALYPKKKAERKSNPVLTALLAGMIGLGAGFGGGYLAVKNYMPEPTVIYQTVPAPTTTEAKPEESAQTPVQASVSTEKTIQEVAESASKTVVEIQVENTTTSFGLFGGTYISQSAGSGVIISEDGYIITNNHVVEGAQKVTVTTYDGTTYDAKVIGTDAKSDIGVIKVDATGLNAAVIGDSDALRVGDTAIVIGNPLGTLGGTVTNGIISATDREMTINNQSMTLIQTNAAINNGNSGGGLFDGSGNLVGIVNARDSGMTGSGSMIEGLGFAIPINTAFSVAQDLMSNGYVTDRPTIGVGLQTLDQDYREYKAGLYISKIYEGGAAEAAGLMEGDRIIKAEGKEISSCTQLTRVLSGKHVGDTMTMTVEREGEEIEVTLTLTGVLASMQNN
ncbi:MAG: trypsin-like peptidase domain-containing protein [Solobacterium sp.]|nr:trypsin-like peptidase domain-containing protein [Solobacterium sp.]